MLEFFIKEYLWIIGILISLFAIYQTRRINKLNSRKRNISLYYKIKLNVSLDVISENIAINFQGAAYSKICYAECIIGNNGNVAVLKNDIVEPIKIIANNPIKILAYNIIDQTTNDNNYYLNIDNTGLTDCLQISFNQIYLKDAFKFYILFVPSDSEIELKLIFNYNHEMKIDTKIVRNVTYYDSPYYREPYRGGIGCGLLSAFLAMLYLIFLYTQKLFENYLQINLGFSQYSSESVSFFVALLPSGIVVWIFYVLLKKYDYVLEDKFGSKQTPFGKEFDINKR